MRRILRFVCLILALVVLVPDLVCATETQNIARLAKITTDPACDAASIPALTDGDPARGLLFAAGTKGEGTITLRFAHPREISRIRLRQSSDVYYSTSCEILGDPDGSDRFAIPIVRSTKLSLPGVWEEFAFQPVRVIALQFRSLTGVSKGLRAHPALGELEIWGKPEPGDQEELIRMGDKPAFLTTLKPLHIETDIAAGGKACCTILVPEGEAYAALGKALADEIFQRAHARPPVTSDASAADPAKTNVIALGQMINNRLIERLYWNRYTFADSAWPGSDGFCLQSVHNPYPWTSGHNVILLGGSTEAGVKRAVEEFVKSLPTGPELRLGYLMHVELPPAEQRQGDHYLLNSPYITYKVPAKPLSNEAARALLAQEPTENLLSFLKNAVTCLVTGEQPYIEAARKALLVMCEKYEREPDREPTWPEETNSRFIFAMWDAVEESPVFTDAERLRVTNVLLRFLYSLVPRTSGYGTLEKNDTIIWNHTTFPLMGLYFGGRYFRRYYDVSYMDSYLRKAAGAFSGQERSWKPQCDADSYLTLTMGHTIEYCLAEGRMKFFESGLCRAYADYLMGICDNRGWAAGFGDSGIHKNPSAPLAGVPYALWYYRDGRYLWYLNAITQGKWANPYHPDVKPVPPEDNVGVRVYPLDRQVYDYTKTRSYYGEPLSPPNVPYEQAFDKISFREDLDPLGQYFILDGYARGKHLHYDGNAILKLTQDGEDWLVDGDYLVRNTTEHNMVTVIRDGRCEEMIPACAGLLHHADLPTRGFTVTVVKDYNGADWERYIAWQKGGWVVVTDRLRAVKPGRYNFDCVWKFIDQSGEEMRDRRRFYVARGHVMRSGHYLMERVKEPEAKGGEVMIFTAPESQFQTVVNLPAGEYRAIVQARAVDTSSDSLWMSLDSDEPIAHHIPLGHMGPSSTSPQKDMPSPVIKITQPGEHLLTLTLRENPGIVMDRIIFEGTTPGAGCLEITAAGAPPAPQRKMPEAGGFHVVSAEPVSLSLVRRRGSSGPVKTLLQRQSATLREGEAVSFRNLLYLDKRGEQKGYDLFPLGANACCLTADGKRIIACGGLDACGLSSDAAMAEIGADRVCLVDATRLAGTQELFTASQPLSMEINLETGEGMAVANKDTELKLAGGTSLKLSSGKHPFKLEQTDAWKQEVSRALERAVPPAASAAPAPPVPQASAQALREVWQFRPKVVTEVSDVASADMDGDGRIETLACVGSELVCLDDQGKERWRFACKRPLLCVCVADVNGDGKLEILCGGQDQAFHILDANSRLLAEHEMTEKLVIGQGGTTVPNVKCIAVGDLDGDGKPEIVVGTSNSNISAFRWPGLERVWTRSGVYHGAGRIALADLDGDGRPEVLVSDHYGSVHAITSDGRREANAYSELGDVVFDTGDLAGNGKLELLNGSSTGVLTASAYPINPLWAFNNYGYPVRAVLARDLDGDGKAEIIAGLDSGYLFALGGDGKVRWQVETGSAVLSLVSVSPNGGLIASLRDGSLLVVSPKGEVLMRAPQPSPVIRILPVQAQPERLLVLDEANSIRLLEFSR